MNPEKMPDKETLLQELEAVNDELIENNASNRLSDEAVAAKEERKRELEALIAEQ